MADDESTGSPFGTGLLGSTARPVPRWVAYLQVALFVGVGVALLLGGIHRYDAAQPIAAGRTTTGTVVAVNTTQSCGRHGCSTHWVPAIKFRAANRRTFTFVGPESNNEITSGDHVPVSYDPTNPGLARDISAGAGDAFLLMGIGTLAILAGRRPSSWASGECTPCSTSRPRATGRLGWAGRSALGRGSSRRRRRHGRHGHSPACGALRTGVGGWARGPRSSRRAGRTIRCARRAYPGCPASVTSRALAWRRRPSRRGRRGG